jgi:hypothetical protein
MHFENDFLCTLKMISWSLEPRISWNKAQLKIQHRKHFTITTVKWLMMFRRKIGAFTGNHTKHINTLSGQNKEAVIK